MNLLNFATVLIVWVIGMQYLINSFIRPLIEELERRKGKATDEAQDISGKFIRKCQWVILFLLIFIIIIATYGYITTLTAN